MRSRIVIAVASCILAMQAAAIDISNRYRSPRNPERQVRRSTELIVLHTTEAPARSSINKVSERGECHFVVTEEGSVYAIVDRDREAFHAGRSMWNGREDVDKFSIGIECVGYHDQPMGNVQLAAIAALVKELKAMYRIPDERVVCHSHVAYGAPNKWQKRRHRGRKRCGMLFAMASVRRLLGLKARPARDIDTWSGRLSVGDPYLQGVLYGGTDTMRAHYGQTVASSPAPVAAPKPAPAAAPKPAHTVASRTSSGSNWMNRFLVKGGSKPAAAPTSVAELKARGYVIKGTIAKSCTAVKIVGSKWNAADTFYSIRNKVYSGKGIDPARLEVGMSVWRKDEAKAVSAPATKAASKPAAKSASRAGSRSLNTAARR